MMIRLMLSILLLAAARGSAAPAAGPAAPTRFGRVFCWGAPSDEAAARAYREIGVTDICVHNERQLNLALQYGLTPYAATFTPCGPHGQVMRPEEEAHFAYINGADLTNCPAAEKKAILDRRRAEKNHRYGGEPDADLDTLNSVRIRCFLSDTDHALSKAALDTLCSRVPGVKGVYFDYLGYSNFKGCYCTNCLAAYRTHLQKQSLADTPKSRDAFYRDQLVRYYNAMIDDVKSKHPEFQVVVHIYPVFLPDPLYGNRTKADFCGQTVAWYFPWEPGKIARYTRMTLGEQNRYFDGVQGVPFLGINRQPGSLWVKDAATLERELQAILAAGGDRLMVCGGRDMLDPDIAAVFKKYCAPGGAP